MVCMKPCQVGSIHDVLGVLGRFEDPLRFAWKLGFGAVGILEMENLWSEPTCGGSCLLTFGETEAMTGVQAVNDHRVEYENVMICRYLLHAQSQRISSRTGFQ